MLLSPAYCLIALHPVPDHDQGLSETTLTPHEISSHPSPCVPHSSQQAPKQNSAVTEACAQGSPFRVLSQCQVARQRVSLLMDEFPKNPSN